MNPDTPLQLAEIVASIRLDREAWKARAELYKEALSFYAESEWNEDYPGGITYALPGMGYVLDMGNKARTALQQAIDIEGGRK